MKQLIRSFLASTVLVVTGAAVQAAALHPFNEGDGQEIKALFLKQALAATAHDIVAFEQVFAPGLPSSPNLVTFVARAYQYWDKQALIDHFEETFRGVWKFEPDSTRIQVIPLTADSAEIYAPTQVTFGTSDSTARTSQFLMCEIAVRTSQGWRIASIIPVPAR